MKKDKIFIEKILRTDKNVKRFMFLAFGSMFASYIAILMPASLLKNIITIGVLFLQISIFIWFISMLIAYKKR